MPGEPLSVVIPAAGLGRRMKSHGPKALIRLSQGGETLLGRQLRLVRELFPVAEVVVVLGHESDRILRSLPSWVRATLNTEYEETNVARSIGLGLEVCSHQRALVIYGDLVFNREALLPFTSPHNPAASAALVDTRSQFRESEVGVSVVGNQAHFFCYGLGTKWGQVIYLARREMWLFRKQSLCPLRSRHFGYEVLNEILGQDATFLAVQPAGMRIAEVDSFRDVENAKQIIREGY